jgi:site-specific DNA-methyltransferase (cytosine-N4-specific)
MILDPFMGSGTVAQVAQDLGRRWLGCELNPAYAEMCERRTRQAGLVLSGNTAPNVASNVAPLQEGV